MKEINWDAIATNPTPKKLGAYSSGKEMMAKAYSVEQDRKEAEELMRKAYPIMEQLFQIRFRNGTPLTVMRPLTYRTSALSKSERGGSFIEVDQTVRPGTVLHLTSVDPHLQEFVFKSDKGEELGIPFISKNALYTQTDIYEVTKLYLEGE